MENLLQGIPKVCVYTDPGLVTGTTKEDQTKEDHLTNLTEVLRGMSTVGMRMKRESVFMILQLCTLAWAKASNQHRKRSAPSKMPRAYESTSVEIISQTIQLVH